MECRDAQFYLRLRRPAADELGPDATAPLDGHLAGCPACAADARAAASFDRALAFAMQAVPLPAGLHARLLRHVATKRGAILRRRAYRAGGLVAAAILVVCIGLGVFSTTRPRVDAAKVVDDGDNQINNPAEFTRRFLAAEKLPERLPADFDYGLLVSCGFERVQGKDVPVVVFRSPDAHDRGFAKVYVFRHDGTFDLKGVEDAQASHTRAQVVIGKDQFRGVTYVFVHTGGPDGLQQFLRTSAGA